MACAAIAAWLFCSVNDSHASMGLGRIGLAVKILISEFCTKESPLAIVLRSQWMSEHLKKLYFGSTIKMINISQLSALEIPLPTLGIQKELAKLFLSAEKAKQAAFSTLETRQQILEYILDKTLEEVL